MIPPVNILNMIDLILEVRIQISILFLLDSVSSHIPSMGLPEHQPGGATK